jgi:hypothetical protein
VRFMLKRATLEHNYFGHCDTGTDLLWTLWLSAVYFVYSDTGTNLFWSVCHRDTFMLSIA